MRQIIGRLPLLIKQGYGMISGKILLLLSAMVNSILIYPAYLVANKPKVVAKDIFLVKKHHGTTIGPGQCHQLP